MKKRFLLIIAPLVMIFFISLISASCDLNASLINQDPYPAVPGDYVKLVFQLEGVSDPGCGDISFELLEKYPLSLDPGKNSVTEIKSGTYIKDFQSFLMIPYKVRIDENALDGENPLEVIYSNKEGGTFSEQFNLEVKDSRVDFEVYLKNYDFKTQIMTLEILNIGENDVEALTIEIPKQEAIEIKGPNRNILGSLDSNDYASAEFEANLKGENILLDVYYTDKTGIRRIQKETVKYVSAQFENRKKDEKNISWAGYLILIIIILILIYLLLKKKNKKG